MRNTIKNQTYDEERALYNLQNTRVFHCVFAGPADGESALKEARSIIVEDCRFSLRYPLWHVRDFTLSNSSMDELTRAALWYAENGTITHSKLLGIKAIRGCSNITISHCKVDSAEFGWKSDGILVEDTAITAEYLFLDSRHVTLNRVNVNGKYSFQYMQDLEIRHSTLDTKDAFWHSKNVTIRNSVVKGEYLGWYSDGLTLINCKIIGTQPLCYCKNLKLVNCTMEDTDLAFEYSEVQADIYGHIMSIKNPKSGIITTDSVGEIIREAPVMECTGRVIVRDAAGDKAAAPDTAAWAEINQAMQTEKQVCRCTAGNP